MFPTKKPRPHRLRDLEISEVSIVDKPANAQDTPQGRIPRARIVLLKRDTSGDIQYLDRNQMQEHMDRIEKMRRKQKQNSKLKDDPGGVTLSDRKRKKMAKLKSIMKSGTGTRQQLEEAVHAKAVKIAKRDGITVEKAEAQVWQATKADESWERMRGGSPKQEPAMTRLTEAESTLDTMARKRMRKDKNMTYAKAVQECLDAHPEIYKQYEDEMANGKGFLAPASAIVRPEATANDIMTKSRKKSKPADDDDEDDSENDDDDDVGKLNEDFGMCSKCSAPVDKATMKYCPTCGQTIDKRK